MRLKFNAKALLIVAGFAAMLLLGVSARTGALDPAVAIVGVVALLAIEFLVTPLGFALWHRVRPWRN
jgi:hypothetical protein